MYGVIFDVKRFAIHDGPGIRTTVFLKGCPLRCAWCHNPESQGYGVETVDGCRGEVSVGRDTTVDDLMVDLTRDQAFYDESGGGVTFSGGEPLAQPDFLSALLEGCRALDIHATVDTSGHVPREHLLGITDRTDLFLYDLKLMDPAGHDEHVGGDIRLVRDNLRALCDTGARVEVRLPVVPGLTGTAENVNELGRFVRTLPGDVPVWLLPYHRAAMDKYPRFGRMPPLPDTPEPTREEMNRLGAQLTELGLEVRS